MNTALVILIIAAGFVLASGLWFVREVRRAPLDPEWAEGVMPPRRQPRGKHRAAPAVEVRLKELMK